MKFNSKAKLYSVGILVALILTMGFSVGEGLCEDCSNPGVRTPGYWMNHPEAWPFDSIEIGGVIYSKEDAIVAMMAPVAGDKTFTMFPALVAAKLNVWIGNCDCPFNVYMLLGEAQSWFDSYPLGSGVEASSEAWQYSHGENIYWRLDAFNNGLTCAPEAD